MARDYRWNLAFGTLHIDFALSPSRPIHKTAMIMDGGLTTISITTLSLREALQIIVLGLQQRQHHSEHTSLFKC